MPTNSAVMLIITQLLKIFKAMKRVNESTKNAMRLQSIGWVLGTPAGQIKLNDYLMWNFGEMSQVTEIIKETDKSIVICESYKDKTYTRRFAKTRLVCIIAKTPTES